MTVYGRGPYGLSDTRGYPPPPLPSAHGPYPVLPLHTTLTKHPSLPPFLLDLTTPLRFLLSLQISHISMFFIFFSFGNYHICLFFWKDEIFDFELVTSAKGKKIGKFFLKLVIFVSWGVITNQLNYTLKTFKIIIKYALNHNNTFFSKHDMSPLVSPDYRLILPPFSAAFLLHVAYLLASVWPLCKSAWPSCTCAQLPFSTSLPSFFIDAVVFWCLCTLYC